MREAVCDEVTLKLVGGGGDAAHLPGKFVAYGGRMVETAEEVQTLFKPIIAKALIDLK